MIRVLIVEDSPVVHQHLEFVLSSDPELEVVGWARNGAEVLDAVSHCRPDVVTMDLHMPIMGGIESTRLLMAASPLPVVVISASAQDVSLCVEALAAGALSVVFRPPAPGNPGFETARREVVRTVKLLSEVRVVRRVHTMTHEAHVPILGEARVEKGPIAVAAIGASTGGPQALSRVFALLPANLSFPLLVVQHITPGFLDGLVEWLAPKTAVPLSIAKPDQLAEPGKAYFAADGGQLEIGPDFRMSFVQTTAGLQPSVAHLFRSAGESFGAATAAVLMTGMGTDGARELKTLRDGGALTIAQDEGTSIVHGMAGEAIRMGGAVHVLSPESIGSLLAGLGQAPRAKEIS